MKLHLSHKSWVCIELKEIKKISDQKYVFQDAKVPSLRQTRKFVWKASKSHSIPTLLGDFHFLFHNLLKKLLLLCTKWKFLGTKVKYETYLLVYCNLVNIQNISSVIKHMALLMLVIESSCHDFSFGLNIQVHPTLVITFFQGTEQFCT